MALIPLRTAHHSPMNTEVTVWAPEPSAGGDDIIAESVEQWIQTVNFESTEDVPIPDRLVDQVIGQEAGSIVIKKAAEQRRHMLMIGDPGTGKSMLARSDDRLASERRTRRSPRLPKRRRRE
jgi:predicted ATP-dependent protease